MSDQTLKDLAFFQVHSGFKQARLDDKTIYNEFIELNKQISYA